MLYNTNLNCYETSSPSFFKTLVGLEMKQESPSKQKAILLKARSGVDAVSGMYNPNAMADGNKTFDITFKHKVLQNVWLTQAS